MDGFDDVLFPLGVAFGATGGPEQRNEIVLLDSGRERRNQRLSRPRRRYDAGTGIRSIDDLYAVLAFFEARRGSLTAFRFRDPFDARSCAPGGTIAPDDQTIGAGDGERDSFQLVKRYGAGGDAAARPIALPVAGSVRVAVDGTEKTVGADVSVDGLAGEVTFAAGHIPAPGESVTAGFAFDVPVRFDIDHLALSLTAFRAGQIPSIPLIEVLP